MPIDATELGGFPIFGPLARDELAKLAAGAERIEIDEPGVELTQQGEFGHCMFVVLKGKATVAIDGEHVRDISVGDPFGEIAVLTSGRRTATVVSTTPMVLARIFKRDIWTIEEKNDAFAVELRRIRAAHDV